MDYINFYQRHLSLPGFSSAHQIQIGKKRVLVVGAGGLGAAFAQWMAASGVAHLTIVDHDRVDATNLHRQLAFGLQDVGEPKAFVLAQRIQTYYPHVTVEAVVERFTAHNAAHLLENHQLVADGTDDLETRYIISDACFEAHVPEIFGAVHGMEGQVALFGTTDQRINYRDVYPEPAAVGTIPSCSESGVLGPVAGVVAARMAAETLKYWSGLGHPIVDAMVQLDLASGTEHRFNISPHPKNPLRHAAPESSRAVPSRMEAFEPEEVDEWIDRPEFVWIDVREDYEHAACHLPGLHIPLGQLPQRWQEIPTERVPVFYCYAGVRSLHAMRFVAAQGRWPRLVHLEGGIMSYAQHVHPEWIDKIVH